MPRYRPRARRRRKSKPTEMGQAMVAALRSLGLTDYARRLEISQAWRAAVGEEIADRTEPQSFNRGVLTVRAASSAWCNELTFLKDDLRKRINQEMGSGLVKDIRIVRGKLETVRPPPKPTGPPRPPDQSERDEAEPFAMAISDPDLREHFVSLMTMQKRQERK